MSKYIELSADQSFLVVDEGQTVRDAVSMALKAMGLKKVYHATDATSALLTLEENSIDFIICDRNLRKVSGLELLKEIRENLSFACVPFVMMASEISKEEVLLASEFGIDGYLSKPFVMKDVSLRLTQAVARHLDPTNPERSFDEARVCFQKGEYDQAIKIYRGLQDRMPESARTRVGIGRCLRAQDKLTEAVSVLNEAVEKNGMYVHAFHELGLIYLQMEQTEDAIKAFDAAITVSPLNPLRYEAIADILYRKKQFESAEDYLIRAVKLELAYPKIFSQLGAVFFAQKKLDKAMKYFEQALRFQPNNTSFLNSLGICYKEMGQFDAALKAYNTALKFRQSDTKILFNKVLCQIAMGENERAIKTLNQIIAIDPSYQKAIEKLQILESAGEKKTG